jgi:hypothetical protein
MADVMFAHVSRPIRRNQIVIATDAGNSIERDSHHDRASWVMFLVQAPKYLLRDFHGSVETSHPCERNRILRTDKKDRLHMGSR